MFQSVFLGIAAVIPGCFALIMFCFPGPFLASNGLNVDPPNIFMMRSLAALLLCTIPSLWSARKDPGSPTLKGTLIGLIMLSFLPSLLDLKAVSDHIIYPKVIGSVILRAIIGVCAIILLTRVIAKPAPKPKKRK